MRQPSSFLRMQTVTLFTPTVGGKPVNGGNARVYNKSVVSNVRYTYRGGISTGANVNSTNDGFYCTFFDVTGYKTAWDIIPGETLIMPDVYDGDEPPTEGERTQFYRVTNVSERKTPDNVMHNIGVSAR